MLYYTRDFNHYQQKENMDRAPARIKSMSPNYESLCIPPGDWLWMEVKTYYITYVISHEKE